MPSRTTTIAAESGLHARPAAMFVQAASKSGLAVQNRTPWRRAGGCPLDFVGDGAWRQARRDRRIDCGG